jgi:hypothetical protein
MDKVALRLIQLETLRTLTSMVQICLLVGFSLYTRHNNLTPMVQTPKMLCQMFLIMVSLEEMKVSKLMSCQIIWLRKMQNS